MTQDIYIVCATTHHVITFWEYARWAGAWAMFIGNNGCLLALCASRIRRVK